MYLNLDPVLSEDQLYLNPLVGERISCTCILLCERISCTWILLCERSSILRWCSDWKAPGPMRSILLLERSISSSWLRPASVFSPRLRSRFRLRSRNLPANRRTWGYACWGSGSGSISQRYGSGSFYNQAKIARKTLIPTVLFRLYDFLALKNNVNVPSKTNKQKTFFGF